MLASKGHKISDHPLCNCMGNLARYILCEKHNIGWPLQGDHSVPEREKSYYLVIKGLAEEGCALSKSFVEIMEMSLPYAQYDKLTTEEYVKQSPEFDT